MHRRLSLTLLFLSACTAQPTTPDPTPDPIPDPTTDPVCTEAAPVCDPGCGSDEACLFAGGACGCVAQCDSTAPTCAGGGPNDGCEAGFFCDTSCTCAAEIACLPDAPACDGDGPNDGCADGFVCNQACDCEAAPPPPPTDLLLRPSRTTAVDITSDDTVVAMVNTDHGSVSFFNAAEGQESRIAQIPSSASPDAEPVAVVFHPNRTVAFVANRAAGSVAKIEDAHTAQPRRADELVLGGEVMGLALTPSGAQLWATNWVSGTVTVIDTATMQAIRQIELGRAPFAIVITNDGDADDDDEKALVTDFYARQRAGAERSEGADLGREGLVWALDVSGGAPREIVLAPIESCFTAPVGDDVLTSGCFPNQLNGITVHTAFGVTYAYVTSVAASPEGPVQFNHNVQAVVSVIEVRSEAERRALTKNLNTLVKEQQVDTDGDESRGRRFLNVPNAIDFVDRDDLAIGYVSAAGSDIVVRLEYSASGEVTIGAPSAFNIATGQNPQGLVVRHRPGASAAYVANLISRDLSVLSFRDQRSLGAVESTAKPTDTSSAEFRAWKGKRFFTTGTAIWSKEGWGSCQGCHPMGLTDNVTWKFAAGPRQTIALDGQFASDDPTDMRALNWTAVFDETADFENNTRGVSGGSGAVRDTDGPLNSPSGPRFASLLAEDGETRENHQALNGSLTFVTRNPGMCSNDGTCPDWDLIDEYIQTVRSPRGRPAQADQIALGRSVFEDGGCNKCHAGPKWTISRTFYDVTAFEGELPNRVFETNRLATVPMDTSVLVGLPRDVNVDATLIAGDDSDGGAPALKRQACNIRNVGSFDSAGGASETRANGQPAQGRNGFNPPSLLGTVTGAPYLHHGAAADLEDLFDARFSTHTRSGNPNFAPTAEEQAALTAFLRALDESTTPFPILPGTVLCPTDG